MSTPLARHRRHHPLRHHHRHRHRGPTLRHNCPSARNGCQYDRLSAVRPARDARAAHLRACRLRRHVAVLNGRVRRSVALLVPPPSPGACGRPNLLRTASHAPTPPTISPSPQLAHVLHCRCGPCFSRMWSLLPPSSPIARTCSCSRSHPTTRGTVAAKRPLTIACHPSNGRKRIVLACSLCHLCPLILLTLSPTSTGAPWHLCQTSCRTSGTTNCSTSTTRSLRCARCLARLLTRCR